MTWRILCPTTLVASFATLIVFGAPANASETPAQSVHVAIVHTQAERTAEVTLKLTGTALQGVTALGSGSTNLSTGAMEVAVHYSGSRASGLVLHELFVDQHFYMSVNQGGESLAQLLNGKIWVEEPVGATSASTSGSPSQMLAVLAASGSAVIPLGQLRIGGTETTGYSVTPDPNYIQAKIEAEHIPSSLKQGALAFAKNTTTTYKVWVDSNHLLRRMAMTFAMSSGTTPGQETVTMDFSRYGMPVSISAPRSSEVASYQQFLAAEQQATSQ
jgi:hypothetical protein